MKRGGPLRRKKGIRKVNPERRADRFSRAYGPPGFVLFTQLQPCAVCCEAGGRSHCAHVRSRGAGGTWTETVPLCAMHHTEQHWLGIQSFQEKYGINLTAKTRDHHARWCAYRALYETA